MKEWIELKKVIEDVDAKKKRQEYEFVTPEELIKSRTGLGVNEALKENYSALADSLENFAVKDMSEVVKSSFLDCNKENRNQKLI